MFKDKKDAAEKLATALKKCQKTAENGDRPTMSMSKVVDISRS